MLCGFYDWKCCFLFLDNIECESESPPYGSIIVGGML